MKEFGQHFYIPEGILVQGPSIANGSGSFVAEAHSDEVLTPGAINCLRDQFAIDMELVAADLKSDGLARQYAGSLFKKLVGNGANTLEQLVIAGSQEFYHVGKYVLGPLAVSVVDTVLKGCNGKAIFPARDATPFFHIAKTLKKLNPDAYPVAMDDIVNPDFNRTLWGVEDEEDQDPEGEVMSVSHPLVQKLLSQMGFFSDQPKTFIEVGCWGSMVDELNKAMKKGDIPTEEYSVYFLYTHLPNNIYGFTNIVGENIPEDVLETIADTWEAFPKFYKKVKKLVEEDGIVKGSRVFVNSPFLQPWTEAALQGVEDAASDFICQGQVINPQDELLKLWRLSIQAQSGQFTGVLPGHTKTWSKGEEWKANWKWGRVPPLK
ncbi:MAG: hypothetical protein HY344_00610 [Candidatus Levybacteria bacterium]|nr:hypothetical protein [Candidatus Levybacteria bacterium]